MQPNCGGRKPTQNEYTKQRKICCGCCYLFAVALIVVVGLIGFLATNQMAGDVQVGSLLINSP